MSNHSNYYRTNVVYSSYLASMGLEGYRKISGICKSYLKKGDTLLDVGCGTGKFLELVQDSRWKVQGVEISKPSITACLKKMLKCRQYDGRHLPFKDGLFSVVVSLNVLEHVDAPGKYLSEMNRVLKPGGYMFVVCPNFLAISNSFHRATRGIGNKVKNLIKVFAKLEQNKVQFEKMTPTSGQVFLPDDDAVNLTNPIDIRNWAKGHKLKEVYWSSQEISGRRIANRLDWGWFRYFLGACFFVLRKS